MTSSFKLEIMNQQNELNEIKLIKVTYNKKHKKKLKLPTVDVKRMVRLGKIKAAQLF